MTPDFKAELTARTEALRGGAAWRNYLDVRELIFRMMDDWSAGEDGGPSAYWREEIEGFLYLFDASPLLVESLREQCYHITGIKSYEYRSHHGHKAGQFEAKQKALAAEDKAGLWFPEPPTLGGFGFDIAGGLVNIDTLKFYEVLIGMEKSGALRKIRGPQPDRRVVVEIGSGWGGFAYQFAKACPGVTYVCVDLPPTMLFSGVYLKTLFPQKSFLFYGEPEFEQKLRNLKAYDFVFMPHFYWPGWRPKAIDFALNMVSFQEMTTEQVDGYVGRLKALGCPRLYSLNRDRSKHNTQLTTVSEVLGRHYDLDPVAVIDMQYTELKRSSKPAGEPGVHDYRHYLAHR